MAANFQDVANQFVPFYYQTFDTTREALASLYRDTSMLTYESASVVGVAAIVDKLKVSRPVAPPTSNLGADSPSSGSTGPRASLTERRVMADLSVQSLPFQNVKHETSTIDPMPGFGDSGVLIQVTGFIVVRLNPRPICTRQSEGDPIPVEAESARRDWG